MSFTLHLLLWVVESDPILHIGVWQTSENLYDYQFIWMGIGCQKSLFGWGSPQICVWLLIFCKVFIVTLLVLKNITIPVRQVFSLRKTLSVFSLYTVSSLLTLSICQILSCYFADGIQLVLWFFWWLLHLPTCPSWLWMDFLSVNLPNLTPAL